MVEVFDDESDKDEGRVPSVKREHASDVCARPYIGAEVVKHETLGAPSLEQGRRGRCWPTKR